MFHLQEIAEDELARDWTKRRMKDDLVPETARVSAHLREGQGLDLWVFPNCSPNLSVSDQDRLDLIPLWQPCFCDLGHLLILTPSVKGQ